MGVSSVPYTFEVAGSVPRSSIMSICVPLMLANFSVSRAAFATSTADIMFNTGSLDSVLYIASSWAFIFHLSLRSFVLPNILNASKVAAMLFAVVVLPLPTPPRMSSEGCSLASVSHRDTARMFAFVEASTVSIVLPRCATILEYACNINASTSWAFIGSLNRTLSVVAHLRVKSA